MVADILSTKRNQKKDFVKPHLKENFKVVPPYTKGKQRTFIWGFAKW